MPDYVLIRTSQNVEISYKLAGLGSRIGAKLIDLIVITGYFIFVIFVVSQFNSSVLFGVLIIPAMLYSFLFEKFNNGQTPGKNVCNLRIVSADGDPVTTSMYLLRWLLLLADLWIGNGLVGIISLAASEKNQRLGDMVAGTLVISLKSTVHKDQLAYEKIPEQYQPIFIEASRLTDQDVQIIKKVLFDKSEKRYELLTITAKRIEELLNISKSSSSQTFLQTVVKDYNYYQNQSYQETNDLFYNKDNNN